MQPTFDTTNTTKALCTYIASNTIALGTSTKPATAEITAQQITLKIGTSSNTKESDAFSKRDHWSTAHASDQLNDHGVDTHPKKGVYSKTGGKHQFKQRSLEDTNRNKALQDHRNQQISPHRRDTFTPANELALGNKNDHLVGLPLHNDSTKIRATMDTSLLNRDNRQDTILQDDSLGLAYYQQKQEVQKLSYFIGLSSEADCLLRDFTTTVAEGPSSSRHSISWNSRARNPNATSNSVDAVLNFESPSPNSSLKCSPAEKPGCEMPETRHYHQRRFDGQRQKPHTTKWIVRRIQEEDLPIAKGILSAWMHHTRHVEASEATIDELNAIANNEIVEAINELRTPKCFVHKDKGNKLETRVILTTLDDSQSLKTTALLNSGCTGSTINIRFVKQHNLPTQQLPRPIPVYNADGTLNSNNAITETCKLHMTIQDHIEDVNFAVFNIGNSHVYIEYDWLTPQLIG
jgi:hypothetical protein